MAMSAFWKRTDDSQPSLHSELTWLHQEFAQNCVSALQPLKTLFLSLKSICLMWPCRGGWKGWERREREREEQVPMAATYGRPGRGSLAVRCCTEVHKV